MSFSEQDLQDFKSEAFELLDGAEKSLLAIGSETDFKKTFDAVFRCFHNLKGAAGMMELLELQAHTHELETKFMSFKDQSTIPAEDVGFFLKGIDRSREILSGKSADSTQASEGNAVQPEAPLPEPQVHATPPSSSQVMELPGGAREEFFSESEEIIQRVELCLKKLEASTQDKDSIDALYRDFHSLKGSAYLLGFVQLGEIAHLIESSLEPIRDGAQVFSKATFDGVFRCLKVIELELQALKAGQSNEKIKALIPALARVLKSSTQASVIEPSKVVEVSPTMNPIQPPPTSNAPPVPAVATKEKDAENSSIRVPVALLDNLMTLMGEMVLVRNQVLQFSNNSDDLEFSNLSKRLNAVTSEIQDEMMKTRMQPIGNVLNKFSRVARDLSQELGKSISLVIEGAETELDKSLLEAIKDPLTHIVRNSCDHGIETPAVRSAAGKPETGTISIRSFHEGGQVVIEVRDDGKGLDPEVLIRKALEKGLITEAQSKLMSEREVFNLIFAPGFSTAKQITNVSGRGVGMDVVRTNIEKIGGTVDLKSVPTQGTTILIKIPLTLAIVPALIVNSATGIFAIPQVKLVELVRVDQNSTENKIEYLLGAPVYRLRGNVLPLVDLNQILGLKQDDSRAAPSFVNIAVLSAENRSFGLIVEEVQDTADIVVKPLNRLLKSLSVYSGATILGDGSVALILDVMGLSKLAQIGRDEQNHVQLESAAAAQAKRISLENQEYILVKVNSPTKHAIVLGYVHRLEEFKASDIEYSGQKRVIRYRDSLLHIVNANTILGYPDSPKVRESVPIIVVEKAGALFGIEVDEILDTLSSDVDPTTSLVKQNGIFGNLNTPSELIVVVDPFELISSAYETPETVATPSLLGRSSRPLKVLLVEDTVFFKKAISLVLSKAGHEVTHAHDGQEAFELFSQRGEQFDVIVSDIEMPRMNGIELAKAVRVGKVNPKVPMLAVSSKAHASHVQQGISAGFDVYMEKLKPDFLLKSIHDLAQARKGAA